MVQRITKAKEDRLVADYQSGLTWAEIREKNGISDKPIMRVLRERGVLRRGSHKLTSEQHQQMVEEYIGGKSSTEVGKKFGIAGNGVLKFVKRAGVTRSLSDAHRKCTLNECAFDVLTPEAAYWLGFLMTDGNVYHNNVQVTLSVKDVGHLEKLRTFLGSSRAISYGKPAVSKLKAKFGGKTIHSNGSAILSVASPRLVKKLAKFGIVPRKTGIEKAPSSLAFNLSFWRGCLDGDGHLGLYRTKAPRQVQERFVPRVSLCGTKKLLRQFKLFVENHLGPCTNKIHWHAGIWALDFDGSKADKLIYLLYGIPGEVSLDRKQQKAFSIMLREIPEPLSPGRDAVTGRWSRRQEVK